MLSTSAGDSDSAGLAESAPTKEAIPRACTSPDGRERTGRWRAECDRGMAVAVRW